MSQSQLLATAALALFAGSTLLLSRLRWFRRRPLLDRLAPYVPGGSSARSSGVLLSADSFGQVIGPLARAFGERVDRAIGITEALALRLERVHSPLDVTAFRVCQLAWTAAGLAVGTGVAMATMQAGPVALVLIVTGPLIACLVVEQRLAWASQAWQRRIFMELPVVAEQLGMLLSAGYSLGAGLSRLADRGKGACGRDLQQVVGRIRQGLSETEALREWAAVADVDAQRGRDPPPHPSAGPLRRGAPRTAPTGPAPGRVVTAWAAHPAAAAACSGRARPTTGLADVTAATRPTPARAPTDEAGTWPADTLVYPPSAARFGDQTWRFTDLPRAPNVNAGSCCVRFGSLPEHWRRFAREYLMALVDTAALRDVGVIRQRPAKARTLIAEHNRLVAIAKWATAEGLGPPAEWETDVPSRYLRHLRTASLRTVEQAAETLTRFWRHRALFTDSGLSAEAWPGTPARRVPALVLRGAAPPAPDGCTTPVISPESFFALLGAALAYVTDFSADILAASRPKEVAVGCSGEQAVERLTAWAADPTSRVPVADGVPLYRRLAALTGIHERAFRPYRPAGVRLHAITSAMVAAGRVAPGGYGPAFIVTRADGTRGPWRSPIGPNEARTELRMLRAAAYIVLLALTGMRDSEAQDVRKDSLHERMGTLAVITRRHKHTDGDELFQWVSDDAAVAYTLLARLSAHPSHVVASLNTRDGQLTAGMHASVDLRLFATHVNAGRHQSGLAVIADTEIHPQRLRHTFAYVAGLFEGGDLVVGDRFGHAFATTTASYQRHRPDDEWLRWKQHGRNDAALRRLVMLAELLDRGGSSVGRDAAEIQATATQIKALVVSNPRAAQRLAAQHAQRWRPGRLLDCNYDHAKPDLAVCRQIAVTLGVPNVGDGPLPDLCPAGGCANATVTPLHAPAVRAERDAALERAAGGSSPVAAAQAQAEADQLTAVLRHLDPQAAP